MKVTSARGQAVMPPPVNKVVRLYKELCRALDTPRSLSCYLLAEAGEWDQLVSKKVRATEYQDPPSFKLDYLAVSALSKASFLPTTFNRRDAAKATFWAAEEQCAETNKRLDAYAASLLMPRNPLVHGVLHRAREYIRRILGESPRHALRSFKLGLEARRAAAEHPAFRFGPGVTSVVKRYIAAAEKYSRRVDVTPSLYPYWRDVCGPRWASHIESVALKATNTVTFVPKNAKTFRTIAVEPHLNGYAQLGVAGLLRRRMALEGIDLATQADKNRRYAVIASKRGSLATVDLSSASDTVSRNLVWLLLPEEWAKLLDTVRSPYGVLDGVEFEYAKFSSMGNGCTFELETLLFYALARSVGSRRSRTAVFGDDIVVETKCVPLLREVLDFTGFTVNEEKTFSDGPFRESCGVDAYHGVDVRPFFWKDLDVPLWFKMANDLRAFARTLRSDQPRKARLQTVWFDALQHLPRRLDVRVPPGYDSFGVVDRPPQVVRKHEEASWDGFAFTGVAFRSKRFPIHDSYQAMLYCLDGGSFEGLGVTSFRGIGCWERVRLGAFGSWMDDGAWG